MQRAHAIGLQILSGIVILTSVGLAGWYLGGHGGPQNVAATPSYARTPKRVVGIDRARGLQLAKAVHAMLDDKLADYPSARFKDVYEVHYYLGDTSDAVQNAKHHTSDLDSYILCGLVNAKNHFGAYTGWVPFMVETGAVHIATDDTNESAIIASFCAGKGDGAGEAIDGISAENKILAAITRNREESVLFGIAPSGPSTTERVAQSYKQEDENKLRENLFPTLPHAVDRSAEYARAMSWVPQTAMRTTN